jgi:hypothetical protein
MPAFENAQQSVSAGHSSGSFRAGRLRRQRRSGSGLDPPRRRTAVIHMTLLALLALQASEPAPLQAQDDLPGRDDPLQGPRPGTLPKEPPAAPPVWRIKAGIQTTYDSNVIKLDDRDIRRLEDGLRPDKFRIEQPDDIILAPWIEAAAAFDLLGGSVWGGLAVQPHVYLTNDIMTYEELSLFLRHEQFEVEYEFEHDRYRREYRDLDTDEFESAFYSEHTVEGRVRLLPRGGAFQARLQGGVEFRDYESPFSHRDHVAFFPGARASFEATPWMEVLFTYEWVVRNSFATSTQPDTSYMAHVLEPGLEIKPMRGLSFGTSYALELREYTTDNDPDVDPGHRDREDVRRYWTLEAGWKPVKSVALNLEYRRSNSESDLPHDPGASEEETEWSREEIALEVAIQF